MCGSYSVYTVTWTTITIDTVPPPVGIDIVVPVLQLTLTNSNDNAPLVGLDRRHCHTISADSEGQ